MLAYITQLNLWWGDGVYLNEWLTVESILLGVYFCEWLVVESIERLYLSEWLTVWIYIKECIPLWVIDSWALRSTNSWFISFICRVWSSNLLNRSRFLSIYKHKQNAKFFSDVMFFCAFSTREHSFKWGPRLCSCQSLPISSLPPLVGVSPAVVWQHCPMSVPVSDSPWLSPDPAVTSGSLGSAVSTPSSSPLVL